VTTKPWQLKPILNPSEGTVSKRFTASGFKRKRKRSYEGRWFAQSRTIYRIWWDFLLRAYQSPDITVDVEFYERWGDPDWFQSIDVWETGYARKYYDPWFIKRGAELFAEHPDRGIRVLGESDAINFDDQKFYLEIPLGTPSKHLEKAAKRIIRETVVATKSSHVPTANFSVSTSEIRTSAYYRWMKMWDLRKRGYSVKEIDEIHGTRRTDPSTADINMTYRNLWKAKRIIKNVAAGEFPGKIN
jgi:hypothetical protein